MRIQALSLTKTGILLTGLVAVSVVVSGCGTSQPQQEAVLQQQYPATYAREQQEAPLSITDIKAMSKEGIKDDTIIAKIRDSHTIFHLGANDILDLHDAGVSQKVLDYMLNTQSSLSGPLAAEAPVAPPPPPAVAQSPGAGPGPGYVWVNGEWVWNNGWYWSGGYWLWPPYSGAVWVAGSWRHGPHGWVREGGHWRR